jgi:hypothetical protein
VDWFAGCTGDSGVPVCECAVCSAVDSAGEGFDSSVVDCVRLVGKDTL